MAATGDQRVSLVDLKQLLSDAHDERFPDSQLVASLRQTVENAEKCTTVAQQLIACKVRTRNRLQGEAKNRLTFEELQLFAGQLDQLPCNLPETPAIKGWFLLKLSINIVTQFTIYFIFFQMYLYVFIQPIIQIMFCAIFRVT